MNIFAKNEFEEEIFYVIFFLFILYYYLPFLNGSKKRKHCTRFAFNNNRPQIEHITKKNTKCKEKKKLKCEGPTNKSTKIPKYFWNFLISKRGSFGQISN